MVQNVLAAVPLLLPIPNVIVLTKPTDVRLNNMAVRKVMATPVNAGAKKPMGPARASLGEPGWRQHVMQLVKDLGSAGEGKSPLILRDVPLIGPAAPSAINGIAHMDVIPPQGVMRLQRRQAFLEISASLEQFMKTSIRPPAAEVRIKRELSQECWARFFCFRA